MALVDTGATILGTNLNGRVGEYVAISSDGLSLATKISSSITRVYSWNGSAWTQKGGDITGINMESVALSSDGNVIVIGNYSIASSLGMVMIFAYNGTSWTQRGNELSGLASGHQFGYSVAITPDGSIIAIGANRARVSSGNHGSTTVYTWNGTSWVRRGQIIYGENSVDECGSAVALSSDGSTVIIGCAGYSADPSNDIQGRIARYSFNGSLWVIGNYLLGLNVTRFGGTGFGNSLDISSDASILAVGLYRTNNGYTSYGSVYTYTWNGSNWAQRGGSANYIINGETTTDNFGATLSLSNDGTYLAVGAMTNKAGGATECGSVRYYKWNSTSWGQVGGDVDGLEGSSEQFGKSVALSGDGTILAVGAWLNQTNGTQTGRIRTFKYQTLFAPDAPTAVSAVAGNTQAAVSFTAPTNNGGATITSYTVTASPGGATASGASSPITVTGLTNGTSYTFTVTATNSVGTSSASSASASVTPYVPVSDLNAGNISKLSNDIVVAGSRSITARKLTKSAGAVNYAPDAATKPSVAISNIPATVQDVTVGVAAADASGIAVVKIVAQDASNNLITDFSASPLTVRVTLPGFTSSMVTIQTSATLGGAVTDTITGYRVGTNLYEFTTTHLTYFSASAYVPCLVAGTRVLTAGGYKAVEDLEQTDLIRTADGRSVPYRLFTTRISATSPETAPYTIPARTFGVSPASTLTVSPYHAIQSAPGVWQIPKYASRMFEGITQAPAGQPITYYHLELPNYFKDNLVVEGTVTESYGNKQTTGMKTVYKFRPELNGFSRLDKPATVKKSFH